MHAAMVAVVGKALRAGAPDTGTTPPNRSLGSRVTCESVMDQLADKRLRQKALCIGLLGLALLAEFTAGLTLSLILHGS